MDAYTIVCGASPPRWRARRISRCAARFRLAGKAAPRSRCSHRTLTLIGNFVLYLLALDHVTPSVTQIVIQVAPLLLLIGGVLVFHERFVRAMVRLRRSRRGLLLSSMSGCRSSPTVAGWPRRRTHAGRRRVLGDHGLAQKQLLRHFTAQQVLWMIYVGATVLLLHGPSGSNPSSTACSSACSRSAASTRCCVRGLRRIALLLGCLARERRARDRAALHIGAMWVVEHAGLGLVAAEGLNTLSVTGALMVVGGSMACALVARKN